jgi:hypothetical protein
VVLSSQNLFYLSPETEHREVCAQAAPHIAPQQVML